MEKHKLYNNSIELTFDPARHTYKVNSKVVYGVTSIIGIINKPQLMYWAVNQAVDFLKNSLEPGKGYDEIEIGNILEGAKYAHRTKSKEATDLGKLFHSWAEDYINKKIAGKGKVKMPVNKKLQGSVKNFLDWEKEHKVKWLSSERKIYSKKYEYAGTLDAEARIDGELSVIDFKTSKAIYDDYFLQTASYIKAREEESGDKYKKAWILRVSKTGGDFEARQTEKIDEHFKCFLSCLEVYKWINNRKKEKYEIS
jgi:hypothetical protein